MSKLIKKSGGTTPTEMLLAELCDQTFLKLWSYPNPFKEDGDELCDLLVVYGDHAFVFFDREKALTFSEEKSPDVVWKRWVRKVVDAQIRTTKGAERYLKGTREIFLDSSKTQPFPLKLDRSSLIVHKFVVANGAKEACIAASESNVTGSLAILYGDAQPASDQLYFLSLNSSDPVHVLDSESLPIVLAELDTIADFTSYVVEKERAISSYQNLMYCGEEDLLAHYLLNFDDESRRHIIGPEAEDVDGVFIGEGEWADFASSDTYKNTTKANEISYFWDELLQVTCQNAFDGTLTGNGNVLHGQSAIFEMAREPRFSRRALSEYMLNVMHKFPKPEASGLVRHVAFMPSFHENCGYVFLQLHAPQLRAESDYRAKRTALLEVACGAAKLKFPQMRQIVGIGMDAPKYAQENEEDFILMSCEEWTEKVRDHYSKMNEELQFFCTGKGNETRRTVREFL